MVEDGVEGEAGGAVEAYSCEVGAHVGGAVGRTARNAQTFDKVEVAIAVHAQASDVALLAVADGAEEAGRVDKLEGIEAFGALVVKVTSLAVEDIALNATNIASVVGNAETWKAHSADVVLGAGLAVEHSARERLTSSIDQVVQSLAKSTNTSRRAHGAELQIALNTGTIHGLEATHAFRAETGGVAGLAIVDIAADT